MHTILILYNMIWYTMIWYMIWILIIAESVIWWCCGGSIKLLCNFVHLLIVLLLTKQIDFGAPSFRHPNSSRTVRLQVPPKTVHGRSLTLRSNPHTLGASSYCILYTFLALDMPPLKYLYVGLPYSPKKTEFLDKFSINIDVLTVFFRP